MARIGAAEWKPNSMKLGFNEWKAWESWVPHAATWTQKFWFHGGKWWPINEKWISTAAYTSNAKESVAPIISYGPNGAVAYDYAFPMMSDLDMISLP